MHTMSYKKVENIIIVIQKLFSPANQQPSLHSVQIKDSTLSAESVLAPFLKSVVHHSYVYKKKS